VNKTAIIIIVLALAALLIGSTVVLNRFVAESHPDYSTVSVAEYGASLLYDTLHHMQYPVDTLFLPVNDSLSLNVAVLIIQPSRPRVCNCMTDDILDWVRGGGRLIFLDDRHPNVIDRALEYEIYSSFGSLRLYHLGKGEVITGRASIVANINLMNNSSYGEIISALLSVWDPDRIYFADYYHGFHIQEGFFQRMPVTVRMLAFQVIILSIILFWYLSKRFGTPIPYYEEVERDENEQVIVLARLYKKADRRKF